MVNAEYANLQSRVFFIWGSFWYVSSRLRIFCRVMLTVFFRSFICIIFVYGMIYETKGLTLEEVDELYERVSKAWKSKQFVPEVRFQDVDHKRGMSISDVAEERKASMTRVEGA